MEQATKKYGKEMLDYQNSNNFVGESELTVTITLAEYRQLVKDVATRDSAVDAERTKVYQRDAEIANLRNRIESLLSWSMEEKTACSV